jgi:hypothetical protein
LSLLKTPSDAKVDDDGASFGDFDPDSLWVKTASHGVFAEHGLVGTKEFFASG